MYHWVSRRIEIHVKICVLGLLLERLVEQELNLPWSKIRKTLKKLQINEFKNKTHQYYQCNEISDDVLVVLKKLNIPRPKLLQSLKLLTPTT